MHYHEEWRIAPFFYSANLLLEDPPCDFSHCHLQPPVLEW